MLGGDAARPEVVQLDQVDVRDGVLIADGDHRHLAADLACIGGGIRRIEEDGGLEAGIQRDLQEGRFPLGIVVGAAEDQVQIVGSSCQVQFVEQEGVVGVGGVAGQHQYRLFGPGLAPCPGGFGVVQGLGGAEHLGDGLRGDRASAFLIQDQGDGGLRNAGQLGDICHGGFFLSHGTASLLCGCVLRR